MAGKPHLEMRVAPSIFCLESFSWQCEYGDVVLIWEINMPTAKWNHGHNLCNMILQLPKKKQNWKEGRKGRQGREKEKESVERGVEEEKRAKKKKERKLYVEIRCSWTAVALPNFFNTFVDQCLLQDLLEVEFVVFDDNGSHPEMFITL